MIDDSAEINGLVEEYKTLLQECDPNNRLAEDGLARDRLAGALAESADWTCQGAEALVHVVEDYGSFMLRNALALAIAMKIEDGQLGY